MSKNNAKLQELQVEIILNKLAAFISIQTTLTATEDVDTSGLLDYITRRDVLTLIEAPLNTKTILDVAAGSLVIDWQLDTIAGDGRTYAQKHGNSIGVIEGAYNDGAGKRTGYRPNYSYTYNIGGDILIVTITDIFAGKLTIL